MGRDTSQPTGEHPLRSWRKGAGLKLAEAAERVGTSRQVWHDWEAGRRRPSAAFMPKVRTLTGLSADSFFAEQAADAAELEQAG